MRILQVHNIYIGKTGEEAVVEEERKVLERHGHQVIQYIKDNSDLGNQSIYQRLKTLRKLKSSKAVGLELKEIIRKEKPDVCHVHNTFPLITPIVYSICKELNLPVVQTLHNYKMVCTSSLLFREGEVCELCLNKNLYNSIKYKCYRDSYLATAIQARVIQQHRNIGTWDNLIDKYICLTDFQRKKIVGGGGIPENKAVVKPNFISNSTAEISYDDFFLFVGRVHDSKGLQDLIYLFKENATTRFVIIGRSDTQSVFDDFENVEYLGEQERAVVLDYMRKCKAVVFPSKYYEGMPIVILEAFSHKKPVISRDRGAMASMIHHGSNGLKYESEEELVKVIALIEEDNELVYRLGKSAFEDFTMQYGVDQGYENLINLYEEVVSERREMN